MHIFKRREGGRKGREGRNEIISPSPNLVGHESPHAGGRMLLGHSAPSCGGPDVFHLFPSALHFLSSFAAVSIIHTSDLTRGRRKTCVLSVCELGEGFRQGSELCG